jgi:hypothetical protein
MYLIKLMLIYTNTRIIVIGYFREYCIMDIILFSYINIWKCAISLVSFLCIQRHHGELKTNVISSILHWLLKRNIIYCISKSRWCQDAWIHQHINRSIHHRHFKECMGCRFVCCSTSNMSSYWRGYILQK